MRAFFLKQLSAVVGNKVDESGKTEPKQFKLWAVKPKNNEQNKSFHITHSHVMNCSYRNID